ncbi:Uncharacterised protein [Mycobacteroides abscessus subsp. abscessus]|nr:Uncharacterised protein [Mycobacteroides abscessus subsp. abscessus]
MLNIKKFSLGKEVNIESIQEYDARPVIFNECPSDNKFAFIVSRCNGDAVRIAES